MENPKILVVEDDPHMRTALQAILRKAGYRVEAVADARDALEKIRGDTFGLILTDLKMPHGSGMEVLREARTVSPATPVMLITGHGTVEVAVEAMKEGAVDFIQKPFSLEELVEAVERCANTSMELRSAGHEAVDTGIVTQDPRVFHVIRTARTVASSKLPVLIQGESGTGKELLARYIHAISPRTGQSFVAINCAAIPENLLESELFGHEKGAFTGANSRKIGKFELADRGTLLLDEIGEMNLVLQAKLLRVLQEWQVDRIGAKAPVPVDVRVIATTNADLAKRVKEGGFREDLYFRLNVIPLTLPPLRERPGDIPLLAQHFLEGSAQAHGKAVYGFTSAAMRSLELHGWEGNVRELKNVVERAVLLVEGALVDEKDLWLDKCILGRGCHPEKSVSGSVKEVERGLILSTLEREGWNRTRAAKSLGISVRTLRNKLNDYRREGIVPSTPVHQLAGGR